MFLEPFRLLHQEDRMPLQGLGLFSLVKSDLGTLNGCITLFYERFSFVLSVNISSISVHLCAAMCEKLYVFEGEVGAGRCALFLA